MTRGAIVLMELVAIEFTQPVNLDKIKEILSLRELIGPKTRKGDLRKEKKKKRACKLKN
ncbi:hypothetical protein ACSBR1_015686 [Camellia fascicularis]